MEVVPQHVRWLLPEEACPCDIFLHFRGQYAVAIPAGQPVSFKVLEKLAKTECTHVYIKKNDLIAWGTWAANRCPLAQPAQARPEGKSEEQIDKQLYGNKRAELLSYVQKSLQLRDSKNEEWATAVASANTVLGNVARLPTLDWYFKQFHEPPDLFHHCARVAYGLTIFCLRYARLADKELENLAFSALIHELEGNPVDNMKTVVSEQTLALLRKQKHPVPKGVTQLIELHDELCSGKGFPSNKTRANIPVAVRVFTLFNHFDHYRLMHAGTTRRNRYEKTKESMEKREGDYDNDLLPLFWEFWERHVEAVL